MVRWALCAGLLACVVGLAFLWAKPGPLSIDEVTYHRMTRGLVSGHGLFVSNGYEDHPSPELASPFIRPTAEGRLAAQYPYGGPVLAAPFYAAFGSRGMLLVNALAFVLAIVLTHELARKVGCTRRMALLASMLLVVTFFSEYSLAIWPHASAVAALLAGVLCAVSAHQCVIPRRSVLLAAAAGGGVGFAAMLRLDALFCVPAITLPFLFAVPARKGALVAIVIGMTPGLGCIVATNYVRWGALSPVTYGPKAPSAWLFAAFGIGGALLIGCAWVATRPRCRAWCIHHARTLTLFVSVALLSLLLLPPVAAGVVRASRGLVAIVFDLRVRPPDLTTTVGTDAVMFIDGFKRSLLQTSPFLGLLVAYALHRPRRALRLEWLTLVPATWIGFYGVFAWHGGLAMNMRYLLPALPFLCIVVACTLVEAVAAAGRAASVSAIAAGCLTFAAYFLLLPRTFEARETFLLTTPLVLVALIAGAALRWRMRRHAAAMLVVIAGISLGWSAAATTQDAVWSRDRRALHYRISAELAPLLTDDALLFAEFADPFYRVVEYRPRVTIAVPFNDDGETAAALVRDARAHGRSVFAALLSTTWRTLEKRGALADVVVKPLGMVDRYIVAELVARQK